LGTTRRRAGKQARDYVRAESKVKLVCPFLLGGQRRYEMVEQLKGIDIKVLRVSMGIKAVDVAFQLKMTPTRLSEIENGRRQVTQETLEKIKNTVLSISKSRK
jgi:hypothetical protein